MSSHYRKIFSALVIGSSLLFNLPDAKSQTNNNYGYWTFSRKLSENSALQSIVTSSVDTINDVGFALTCTKAEIKNLKSQSFQLLISIQRGEIVSECEPSNISKLTITCGKRTSIIEGCSNSVSFRNIDIPINDKEISIDEYNFRDKILEISSEEKSCKLEFNGNKFSVPAYGARRSLKTFFNECDTLFGRNQ